MPILSINHNNLEFRPGMTILEVAEENNIQIRHWPVGVQPAR